LYAEYDFYVAQPD
jgi:hypothetical protein